MKACTLQLVPGRKPRSVEKPKRGPMVEATGTLIGVTLSVERTPTTTWNGQTHFVHGITSQEFEVGVEQIQAHQWRVVLERLGWDFTMEHGQPFDSSQHYAVFRFKSFQEVTLTHPCGGRVGLCADGQVVPL